MIILIIQIKFRIGNIWPRKYLRKIYKSTELPPKWYVNRRFFTAYKTEMKPFIINIFKKTIIPSFR